MKKVNIIKKRISFVTLLLLAAINIVSASNEMLLKSRRFTPAKGITAAAKARIEAVPGRVHVLIQLERIPTIKEKKELEDSIVIHQVPEPMTIALLGLGALLLRRRWICSK
ncbi:MAG: PEP-CTERM sorting domain-containing protein [Planctomycetes bacterium]|nr:PEP-CTERM sorting domain-containing protein [Planctomycetota bacterium]